MFLDSPFVRSPAALASPCAKLVSFQDRQVAASLLPSVCSGNNLAWGGVIMTYVWYESYEAVALEVDWMKMHERIQLAESKINMRKRVLSQDHGGTWEERQAIANALNALGTLQTEVDDWQSRQSAEAERCKR
jgi:hypothetical protein